MTGKLYNLKIISDAEDRSKFRIQMSKSSLILHHVHVGIPNIFQKKINLILWKVTRDHVTHLLSKLYKITTLYIITIAAIHYP